VPIFRQRIFHLRFELLQFARGGNDLPAHGTVWIVGIDQAGKVGRNIDPEQVLGIQRLLLAGGQVDDLAQLLRAVQAVGQLPAPVEPFLIGYVVPLGRTRSGIGLGWGVHV